MNIRELCMIQHMIHTLQCKKMPKVAHLNTSDGIRPHMDFECSEQPEFYVTTLNDYRLLGQMAVFLVLYDLHLHTQVRLKYVKVPF